MKRCSQYAVAICLASIAGSACTARPATSPPTGPDHPPVVRGIDHFFATSPDPEPLYRIFRDTLGLPEVYPFRDYGDFASGVVSMGNVLFEVVTWAVPAGEKLPVELKGLAFEPAGNVEETVARLRAYGLHYEKPDSVMFTDSAGTRRLAYVNTGLDGKGGLPPAMGAIFVNDNLGSQGAVNRRRSRAQELIQREGGPLGIVSVRELVIAVEDRDAALAHWRKLFGDSRWESNGVINWPIGPAMRFVQAPTGSIPEMVVVVRSLQRARQFLESKGMASIEDRGLYIKPSHVHGLRIRLVE